MSETGFLERQRLISPFAPSNPTAARSRVAARMLLAAAVLTYSAASLSVIWFSLEDHALHSHSEGRYAVAAATMADGGSWLVPQLEGRPHLTKPPLTYWLEAAAIRCFGRNEFAVRMPSALAGSLTALAVLALGWRLGGVKQGLLAMGLLQLTPLHITMSRLTLTDSLMGLFWFGVLAGGSLCFEPRSEPRDYPKSLGSKRRWPCVLLWVSFALGMLTKAPLPIVPLGVLFAWKLLAGQGRELRRLHLGWGLCLAMLPLAVWAALILRIEPSAAQLWYDQTIGRAVGTGDHAKPFWFYLPVFFIGLFPATAIIRIPVWHLTWREAWRAIRDGSSASLWVLAVVLPLLCFSLSRGKHFSYLLPLGPPLALVSAGLLKQMLDRRPGETSDRRDPSTPSILLFACLATLATLGVMASRYASPEFPLHWLWVPVLSLTAAAVWQRWTWYRRPAARHAALIVVWLSSLAVWFTASEVEDAHFDAFSTKRLVERIRRHTGDSHPHVQTFGFNDSTVAFYAGSELSAQGDALNDVATIEANARSRRLVLIAHPQAWERFSQVHPRIAEQFTERWDWDRGRWKGRRIVLMAKPSRESATRIENEPRGWN